jgi:hypothetical protein
MFKLVAARAALVRSGRSLLRTSHAPPLISASGNRFLSNASAPPDVSDPAVKPVLPPHIKFRMPDLDFEVRLDHWLLTVAGIRSTAT